MNFLIIIIFILVVIVCSIGLCYKSPDESAIGIISVICLVFCCVGLMVSFIGITTKNDTNKSLINKYNTTKYLIEVYDASKDKNLLQLTNLLENVEYINKEIKEHSENKDNLFIGCFYSKSIAELEPINVKNLNLN